MFFLASEHVCGLCDGKYYLVYRAYSIYVRYAKKFGDMILCSRVEEFNEVPKDYYEASFIREVIIIDDLRKALLGKYNNQMEIMIKKCNLVVVRCPSIIAFKAADIAHKCNVKYIAESMCDAFDSYWNHGLVGKIIAPYMFLKMKSVVKQADYALYVTKAFLQKRYPCPNISVGVSNVVIKSVDKDILDKRLEKIYKMDRRNLSIMTTASVDLHSKGQEYVVKAMGMLKRYGINCKYYLAGDGSEEFLKKVASKAGVEKQIIFLGRIPLNEVLKYIDKVDIYIQPSLQEGLPRALIEAMSRGCPCIGANTAGIPELLDNECIVKRKSPESIVKVIKFMINDGLEQYAKNNHAYSKAFLEERLNDRRDNFFENVLKTLDLQID